MPWNVGTRIGNQEVKAKVQQSSNCLPGADQKQINHGTIKQNAPGGNHIFERQEQSETPIK